jgi:hypothetical protein
MSYGPLFGMCQDPVTVEPWLANDALGVASYGAGTEYPARVEVGSKEIAGFAGKALTARGRVYIITSCTFDVKDRMTLPAWCNPTQPPILSVEPKRDGGTRFCVVYYG